MGAARTDRRLIGNGARAGALAVVVLAAALGALATAPARANPPAEIRVELPRPAPAVRPRAPRPEVRLPRTAIPEAVRAVSIATRGLIDEGIGGGPRLTPYGKALAERAARASKEAARKKTKARDYKNLDKSPGAGLDPAAGPRKAKATYDRLKANAERKAAAAAKARAAEEAREAAEARKKATEARRKAARARRLALLNENLDKSPGAGLGGPGTEPAKAKATNDRLKAAQARRDAAAAERRRAAARAAARDRVDPYRCYECDMNLGGYPHYND